MTPDAWQTLFRAAGEAVRPLRPLPPDLRRAVETAVAHARRHQAELREAQALAARILTPAVLGDLAAELRHRRRLRFLAQMDEVHPEGPET